MNHKLPPRTADTMSDAIAIASPNGRMSGRAKHAAQKRLGEALFGPGGLQRPGLPPQPSEIERLSREAAQCRDHATRGMRRRANIKQAEWCEKRIEALTAQLVRDSYKFSSQGILDNSAPAPLPHDGESP